MAPTRLPKDCIFMDSSTLYDLVQFRPFWARKRGGKPPRKLDLRKGKFSHVLVMGLLTLNPIYSGPHGQK